MLKTEETVNGNGLTKLWYHKANSDVFIRWNIYSKSYKFDFYWYIHESFIRLCKIAIKISSLNVSQHAFPWDSDCFIKWPHLHLYCSFYSTYYKCTNKLKANDADFNAFSMKTLIFCEWPLLISFILLISSYEVLLHIK